MLSKITWLCLKVLVKGKALFFVVLRLTLLKKIYIFEELKQTVFVESTLCSKASKAMTK